MPVVSTRCDKNHLITRDDGRCSYCTLTGGFIWLAHDHYDSPFGEHTGPSPERLFHIEWPVGSQSGTYFKTSKTHDGMTVWLWGGRHPDDVAAGNYPGGRPRTATTPDRPGDGGG